MKALPIHERFYSFQGEGLHLGCAAFFIRTFGCPLHCPWCDSAGTWHADWVPKSIDRIDPVELVVEAAQTEAQFIVVTGGEPTILDLTELTDAAHDRQMRVHLETSGAFPIRGDFHWITLSPKKSKLPLDDSAARANEMKWIIETPEDIQYWEEWWQGVLKRDPLILENPVIWLHPEWSQRDNPDVKDAIIKAVKRTGVYRAGYQMHKLYKADNLDHRTKPLAPLGGDPLKGY